jgi:diguanylate cyclase (GGDEF)-like protein/PAS domain S-box-containing protein
VKTVLHRLYDRRPWRVALASSAWDADFHAALSRTLASILFVVSGLVQCFVLLFPTHPETNEAGVALIGAAAVLVGIGLPRLPARLFAQNAFVGALITTAIGTVGMHNYFIGHGPTQYSIFFIVCYVWLGVTRRRGVSLLTSPILVVAYLAPMVAHHNATPANVATSIYVVTVCVLVGETLAWMVVRLRASEAELERRKVGEALDRTESRYLALIEQLPSVTYIYKENRADPAQTRDEYISPQIVGLLGVTQEEWLREPQIWERYIHPDDRERLAAADIQTAQSGEPFDHEYRMIRPDGRIVWILETARRVESPDSDEVTWIGEYYDITRLREAEETLRETNTRYRTMLEQVPLAIYLEHVNTGAESLPCFYVSPRIASLVGYEPAEWRERRRWERCLHPDDHNWVRARWVEATERRGQFTADYRLIAKDGRTVWVHDEAVIVLDEQGMPKYWHGFMLDITREKEAEVQLRQSEAEFRLLFYKNPLPAWVYDRETLAILEVNEQAIEHYGFSRDEFARLLVTDLVHPGLEPHARDLGAGPAVQRHVVRTGRLIEVEITAYPLTFRERPATLVIAQDVTARVALQAQLSQQAYHDALTGLPNRVLFRDRLSRALVKRAEVAVIFIDLDDFKRINDSLGHSAGDAVLIAVAERLAGCIRTGDTIARLGGDEFTVLLDGCDVPEALAVVDRIHAALHEPLCIDGREMVISPSMGIALGEPAIGLPEELLRRADVAMYVAKRTGKSRHVLFSPEMDQHTLLQLDLEADLRRAIQRDELELHFQPIIDTITGEVSALEALIRWNHPERDQRRLGIGQIAERDRFRDLEHQPVRADPGLGERVPNQHDHTLILEFQGRDDDADRDRRLFRPLPLPLRDLPAGRLHDPRPERDDQPALLCHGDKGAGAHLPPLRVVPADQRLERRYLTRYRIHDRLEMELELASLDRPPQIRLQVQAQQRVLVHLRAEEDMAGLAGSLGHVHGDIRAPQQLFGERNPRLAEGDADARADHHLPPVNAQRLMQGRMDPVDDGQRFRQIAIVEQDGELVAPEPGDRVTCPDTPGQPLRHRDQDRIAGTVAERVVDPLEVIQVDEDDRDLRPLHQRPAEPVPEQDTVGQPGQRIVICLLRELGLERDPGRHVLRDHQRRRPLPEGQRVGRDLDLDQAPRVNHVPLHGWASTEVPGVRLQTRMNEVRDP